MSERVRNLPQTFQLVFGVAGVIVNQIVILQPLPGAGRVGEELGSAERLACFGKSDPYWGGRLA